MTDFGALVALRKVSSPSIVVFRHQRRRPDDQASVLLSNLPVVEGALADGSVVVIEGRRVRIRSSPIAGAE